MSENRELRLETTGERLCRLIWLRNDNGNEGRVPGAFVRMAFDVIVSDPGCWERPAVYNHDFFISNTVNTILEEYEHARDDGFAGDDCEEDAPGEDMEAPVDGPALDPSTPFSVEYLESLGFVPIGTTHQLISTEGSLVFQVLGSVWHVEFIGPDGRSYRFTRMTTDTVGDFDEFMEQIQASFVPGGEVEAMDDSLPSDTGNAPVDEEFLLGLGFELVGGSRDTTTSVSYRHSSMWVSDDAEFLERELILDAFRGGSDSSFGMRVREVNGVWVSDRFQGSFPTQSLFMDLFRKAKLVCCEGGYTEVSDDNDAISAPIPLTDAFIESFGFGHHHVIRRFYSLGRWVREGDEFPDRVMVVDLYSDGSVEFCVVTLDEGGEFDNFDYVHKTGTGVSRGRFLELLGDVRDVCAGDYYSEVPGGGVPVELSPATDPITHEGILDMGFDFLFQITPRLSTYRFECFKGSGYLNRTYFFLDLTKREVLDDRVVIRYKNTSGERVVFDGSISTMSDLRKVFSMVREGLG